MIREGVALSQSLQQQFGKTVSSTLSQRDVPGITRSAIPVLVEAGVTAVSVGVNGGSTPPTVPKLFKWLDPDSGKSLYAMWHPYGYGGLDVRE